MDCQTPPSLDLAASPPLRPASTAERIVAVDVIRGFALFGILQVNMAFFGRPLSAFLLSETDWHAPRDQAVEFLISALCEGKFYVLFSFLFGLGMALQMERAATRGGGFTSYYVRRQLVLLMIGLAHALLLWYGDILTAYALFGFVLLLFRRASNRKVLITAALIYVLPMLIMGGVTGAIEFARTIPDAAAELQASFDEQERVLRAGLSVAVAAYREGSWLAIFEQNLSDLASLQIAYVFIGPMIVTMFLLGLYAGRRGFLRAPEEYPRLFQRLIRIALPLGLVLNVAFAWGSLHVRTTVPSAGQWVVWQLQTLGSPLLAGGYAAILVLLLARPPWRARLMPLAAAGRMALTNYLLQTLICTTVFYSYGLGLYNRLSPSACALLGVAIYAIQVPLSVWWLRHFRFGPMEWLWRTLTYGRLQPFRLTSTAFRPA